MASIIYKNEMIKKRFYDYLGNSKGFSSLTIECLEEAIWVWEDFTHKSDFATFNKTKAEEFKAWIKSKKKVHSNDTVSLSYCYDILRHLKTFFDWLSKQPGYKSKINQTDIEYFNLSKQEVRVATQPRKKSFPTLEEVKKVIESIQGKTEVEMRDKALISLAFLTGARISALSSLPIESFDMERLVIDQNPELGVKTKFSKRITSSLIPLSNYSEPLEYFRKWIIYLKNNKGFSGRDPIFPTTKLENGRDNLGYYNTEEVGRNFWQSTSSARKVFENRFTQAGVKYYHPHTLRHLLVREISKLPLTEEEKKAISQSLGHEDVGTTFGSYGYGKIEENRQIDIIKNIDFEGKNRKVVYQVGEEEMKELLKSYKPK